MFKWEGEEEDGEAHGPVEILRLDPPRQPEAIESFERWFLRSEAEAMARERGIEFEEY